MPNPRDFYHDTIVYQGQDGRFLPIANVDVEVYYANTTTLAALYASYDGTLSRQNPVKSGPSGEVYFYADVGEYEIQINDPTHNVGLTKFRWNAVNASPGGLPLSILSDAILRQLAPVGQVIDWWRPANTVPLPQGWEVCDGHSVAAGAHDFGTGAAVVLPDLRNTFILGADVLNSDGASSTNGDTGVAPGTQNPNAPGIGGTGGSNFTRNLGHVHKFDHSHALPNHVHNATVPNHIHSGYGLSTPDHGHGPGTYYVGDHSRGNKVREAQSPDGALSSEEFAYQHGPLNQISAVTNGVAAGSGALGIGGSTSGQGDIAITTANPTSLPNTGSPVATLNTDPNTTLLAVDVRPKHIGLLKLMKVRRA